MCHDYRQCSALRDNTGLESAIKYLSQPQSVTESRGSSRSSRMKMKKSCFLRLTLFCLQFFGCTYRGLDAAITDACEWEDMGSYATVIDHYKDNKCLLYPSNELNCSWSFQSPENETQIITTIHVCAGDKTVQTQEFKELVRFKSLHINNSATAVILLFNISLHEQLVFKYEIDAIEVLPPPPNVQPSFNDSNLHITWDMPQCRTKCSEDWLEYEVQIGDQEMPKCVNKELFYTEQNVDLTQRYTVRIRTKINDFEYGGSGHWSDWSQTALLLPTQSVYQINDGVIKAISVGIPLVILLLLLPVCQSVSKRLLPPIPSPPEKYLHVLENTDVFVSPDLMANPDEEITLVFEK